VVQTLCFNVFTSPKICASMDAIRGGRVPPTFSDSGDIICYVPHMIPIGLVIQYIGFTPTCPPHILQQNCAHVCKGVCFLEPRFPVGLPAKIDNRVPASQVRFQQFRSIQRFCVEGSNKRSDRGGLW